MDQDVIAGDPIAAAAAGELHYVSDGDPGLRRRRRGKTFGYTTAQGKPVRDPATLARIRALAIPPAWTDVWIAPDPHAHIQATGRDARGRKQYRYHPRWRAVRDEAKYHRFVEFCRALPALRARVAEDLARPALCKEKVVATVVALMESAQLRVGNDEYARTNHSYGATTLLGRHAKVHGDTLELAFRAKSGVLRHARVTDRRLARIVRRCQALPGQRLFQYVDGDAVRPITSTDVNAYLREATGGPFTAKDYRTWAATIAAAILVAAQPCATTVRAHTRSMREIVCSIAERLGHTPAVCRASYIHPRLLEQGALADPAIARRLRRLTTRSPLDPEALRAAESIVAEFLDAPVAPALHSAAA